MAQMLFKTNGNASPAGKARVYFTCHPEDFQLHFDAVCDAIFQTHDCAVYYTQDLSANLDADNKEDLESSNLFVVPVTHRLLSTPNRAMDEDIKFAFEKHIPVLPLMMETGVDAIYARPDKFGELQYLSPYNTDATEISFAEKLKKYLESVLVSDEMAKRVRAAFDAYIFLSYRKKDRKYANQLMRIIHSKPACRDIAIWYDEFLTPGESFRESIDTILADSKLFTLLVTPNLLEDANFVMVSEYPAALRSGIDILPAEMEKTDHTALTEKFASLPEIANPYDDEQFRDRLAQSLSAIAISANDDDPEHNFLIGLAYLDGIDVEVNRERALALITSAAEAGQIDAMHKLFNMYDNGIGVPPDYRKAAYWAQKTYDYINKEYPEKNRVTIAATQRLANAYKKCGEYEKACELQNTTYALCVELLGEDDPNTTNALSNLALLYGALGQTHQQLDCQEKAYEVLCKTQGQSGADMPAIINNLGKAYAETGNYPKALELVTKAYEMLLETAGTKSPYSITCLVNMAAYTSALGQQEKAIELSTKAYDLMCETNRAEHPNAVVALMILANCYTSLACHEKALEIKEKGYRTACSVLGKSHPTTIDCITSLADTYRALDRPEAEAPLREEIYAYREKQLGNYHNDTYLVLKDIIDLYIRLENYEKLAPYEEIMYALAVELVGSTHKTTITLMKNLIAIYMSLKQTEKERIYRQKLYRALAETLGEEHPDTVAAKNELDNM